LTGKDGFSIIQTDIKAGFGKGGLRKEKKDGDPSGKVMEFV
jgi:hypothetical protein